MQGFPPVELKLHYLSGGDFSHLQVSYDSCIVLICLLNLHSNSICCIIRTCGEKLHVLAALSLLYFCVVDAHAMQSCCFFAILFWRKGIILCNYNSFSRLIQTSFNSVSGGLANYNECRQKFCER